MLSASSKKKSARKQLARASEPPRARAPRLPSLATQHKDEVHWKQFNIETEDFNAWMTEPINVARETKPYDSIGNLNKINFATESALVHVACYHDWGPELTYRWLLEGEHFEAVFTSYAEYLYDTRGNDLKYIAKQLGDLRHVVAYSGHWWGHQFEDGNTTAILEKLAALQAQYSHIGGKATKRNREMYELVDSLGELGNAYSLTDYHQQVTTMENELFDTIIDMDEDDITNETRLRVSDCLMLKMGSRGGRGVELHQLYIVDEPTARAWAEEPREDEQCYALAVRSEDARWEFIGQSKDHCLRSSLDDAAPLLELWHKCFPDHEPSDCVFTPTMHGCRASKAKQPDFFPKVQMFAEYFELVAKRELGRELTPYAVRRLNASNLQVMNASPEVQLSHAALMGTGVANLQGTYDRRSEKSKSYLASQVQRHQFNPMFLETEHDRMVPTLVLEAGMGQHLTTVVARLVRDDLLAVFGEDAEGYLELGDKLIHTTSSIVKELPKARLLMDQPTGKQVLRARDATVRRANAHFLERELGADFALQSLVHGQVALRPHDIVYYESNYTIAEVLSVHDDGTISIMLASELVHLPNRSTMQSFFRFTDESVRINHLDPEEVCFPVDVTFIAASGHFHLKKSKNLSSV